MSASSWLLRAQHRGQPTTPCPCFHQHMLPPLPLCCRRAAQARPCAPLPLPGLLRGGLRPARLPSAGRAGCARVHWPTESWIVVGVRVPSHFSSPWALLYGNSGLQSRCSGATDGLVPAVWHLPSMSCALPCQPLLLPPSRFREHSAVLQTLCLRPSSFNPFPTITFSNTEGKKTNKL